MFTFDEIIGRATGAADYLELMRNYEAFIITSVPGMSHKTRDLARRFITLIDAIYESRVRMISHGCHNVYLNQIARVRDEERKRERRALLTAFPGQTRHDNRCPSNRALSLA